MHLKFKGQQKEQLLDLFYMKTSTESIEATMFLPPLFAAGINMS